MSTPLTIHGPNGSSLTIGWDEIVTPGYWISPSSGTWDAAPARQPIMGYKYKGDFSMSSPSISTPEGIAQAIRELAKADESTDLSEVAKAVKCAEAERSARIDKALSAIADLEKLKGSTGRRFVVAYWQHNEVHQAQGIEYPIDYNEQGEPMGNSIHVQDEGHYFYGRYKTMKQFCEFFVMNKIPYALAYYDK